MSDHLSPLEDARSERDEAQKARDRSDRRLYLWSTVALITGLLGGEAARQMLPWLVGVGS